MDHLTFMGQGISPPSSLYIGRDDRLFLRVHNSLAGVDVQLRARLLLHGQGVSPQLFHLLPTSDRLVNLSFFDLAEGFLLDVTLFAALAAPRRGQTFCQAGIGRGPAADFHPVALLISDYLTDPHALGWPGGILRSSVEGPGLLRSITGTDPAAGAEISETVPTNARWRLFSFRATLVTSGAAATRTAHIELDDGVNPYGRFGPNFDQGAGATFRYNAAALGFGFLGSANEVTIGVPVTTPLFQGHRLRTFVSNLQAGDNWSAPQFLVEEWIED